MKNELIISIVENDNKYMNLVSSQISEILKPTGIRHQIKGYSASIALSCDLYIIGIETSERERFQATDILHAHHKEVILMSNDNNLVYDAMAHSPLYFVRKNHLGDDLRKALNLYQERHMAPISFSCNYRSVSLKPTEISLVEICGNHLHVHALGKEYVFRKTLKNFIEENHQLNEKNGFYQLNRSQIVNLKHVKILEKRVLVMMDGVYVSVARSRLSDYQRMKEVFNNKLQNIATSCNSSQNTGTKHIA